MWTYNFFFLNKKIYSDTMSIVKETNYEENVANVYYNSSAYPVQKTKTRSL